MKKASFLLLTSNQMNQEEIEYAEEKAKKEIHAFLNIESSITRSDHWWFEKFAQCGDWETWIQETASGRPYGESGFHFDGFILSHPIVGKANANIMKRAIDRGAVIFDITHGDLRIVQDVLEIDPDDWKSGWSVSSNPVGGE